MTESLLIRLDNGGIVSLKKPLAKTTLESSNPNLLKLLVTISLETSKYGVLSHFVSAISNFLSPGGSPAKESQT